MSVNMLPKDNMKKALVVYAIEQGLIDGGGTKIFEETIEKLKNKYNCTIEDCYENPQYLNNILCEKKHEIQLQIINAIKHKLIDFTYQESIAIFVETLDIKLEKNVV